MPKHVNAFVAFALILAANGAQARVFKSDNGDCRLVGIPMEMQIGRGFCAPATMVRVLKYYRIEADQRHLAEQADCTNDTGTDVETMLDIVARTCGDYGLSVKTHYGFDYNRYRKILDDYNKRARRHGAKRLWYTGGQPLDIAKTFQNADIKILRETSTQAEIKTFEKTIQTNIDADTPLIWGLVLGIVPESDVLPYTKGGHLRLIIGYNRETQEILYSDPWGPRHEKKRMALADAFAITMSLHTLSRATPQQF